MVLSLPSEKYFHLLEHIGHIDYALDVYIDRQSKFPIINEADELVYLHLTRKRFRVTIYMDDL